MSDVAYCPSCGEPVPEGATAFVADLLLDCYRTQFVCPACDYFGSLVRLGVPCQPHSERQRLQRGEGDAAVTPLTDVAPDAEPDAEPGGDAP